MAMQFISVKDALPQKECWCLVWAPNYYGTSAHGNPAGYVFTKFRPNYKIPWGIEGCQSEPVVEYWMELPEDPSK